MKNVLIIEDDQELLVLLNESVCNLGYSTETAKNGKEALSKLKDQDIVLSDWNMPEMNGIEFIRKAKEKNPFIYVALLTGRTSKDDIFAGLVAGADDYITKPFNIDDLEVRLYLAAASIELNRAKRAMQR